MSAGKRRGAAGRAPGADALRPRRVPRMARVNELLREVIAERLERLSDGEDRLAELTVTGIDCDPDLRRAKVYFGNLDEASIEALEEARVRLQGAIAAEARLRRTPQLVFRADPAVEHGGRVEAILRRLAEGEGRDQGPGPEPERRRRAEDQSWEVASRDRSWELAPPSQGGEGSPATRGGGADAASQP